jgi:3-oxocholest-4-en-26-oate---CoA ligase
MICTDTWEAIAAEFGDHPAVFDGDRTTTWREFDHRSARCASAMLDRGVAAGSSVGLLMYNCAEYLEVQFAAFKVRAVPINVNYRYLDDELVYLLDNADCEMVVFHSSLAERVARIRERLPRVRAWVAVVDDDTPTDGFADYEAVLSNYEPASPIQRDPDDLYMLYTGGTTGMPKGVMYRLGGLTRFFLDSVAMQVGVAPFVDIDDVLAHVRRTSDAGSLPRSMPLCPLMHGTGVWLGAFAPHLMGGAVVLSSARRFDPDDAWNIAEQRRATSLIIVGDAFARPLLASLNAQPDRAQGLSSLQTIVSSGAMFSAEVKSAILSHLPHVAIRDVLGSTEGAMGRTVSDQSNNAGTARFVLNPGVVVFDDELRPVVAGSGVIGSVASTSANVPIGYYKDPEKSASTFRTIDGVRYTFHGDMATVEADGSINLLGRGSHCITTGGEKVYPEEVEEVVKTHPAVTDCLVFGVPDERFGQRVVAIASIGGSHIAGSALVDYAREHLASYKVPRLITIVPDVPRAPNGKADYAAARKLVQ